MKMMLRRFLKILGYTLNSVYSQFSALFMTDRTLGNLNIISLYMGSKHTKMVSSLKNLYRVILCHLNKPAWYLGLGSVFVLALYAAFFGNEERLIAAPEVSVQTLFTVDRTPLSQALSLVGTIEPGNTVNIAAPFRGSIKERFVNYGMKVEKGQALLVLDTDEIDAEIRRAQIAMIKSQQALEKITRWQTSTEVTRARNGLIAVQIKVAELASKEGENKKLLAQGVIPKNEYTQTLNELKTQKMQLKASEKNLDAVLKQGDEQHRYLASLELTNATISLEDLVKRREGGNIKAPVNGLLLRPSSSSGVKENSPGSIEIGSQLAKDQLIIAVANIEMLQVRADVDEIDVINIAEGQAVKVTGEAFGAQALHGLVKQISQQSNSKSSRASFEIIVGVASITAEQRKKVRVGMSANLAIMTYENTAAFIIPIPAVQHGPNGPYVVVKNPDSGEEQNVSVGIGKTTVTGVEVLSGLKVGDQIVTKSSQAPLGMTPLARETSVLKHMPAFLGAGLSVLGALNFGVG